MIRQFLSFGRLLGWHFEMLLLFFSADDRGEKRNGDNHAGDKSRVHLQESLRGNGIRRGYSAQTATQFLQSKSQQTPSHRISERRSFGSSGSDSMKPTLLLSDEAEITRLMLKDNAVDEFPVRDTETHVGCNCDRWGHPCPGCVNRNIVPGAKTPGSSSVKQ
jgi:hypothetical protein